MNLGVVRWGRQSLSAIPLQVLRVGWAPSAPSLRSPRGVPPSPFRRGPSDRTNRAPESRRASSPSSGNLLVATSSLFVGKGWRRGWDSNPRYAINVYRFSRPAPSTTRPPLRKGAESRIPEAFIQPLAGASGEPRRARKKSLRSAPHSSASMPRTMSTRWLRRGSSGMLARLPLMPAFGSSAP